MSGLQSGGEYAFYIAACVQSTCGNVRSGHIVNVPPRGMYNPTAIVLDPARVLHHEFYGANIGIIVHAA